MNLRGEGASLI